MNDSINFHVANMVPNEALDCKGYMSFLVHRMKEQIANRILDLVSDGKEYAINMLPEILIERPEICSTEFRYGISVQELVRCKDCVHRDPVSKRCDCGGHEMVLGVFLPMPDDYFCADGERKDGECGED